MVPVRHPEVLLLEAVLSVPVHRVRMLPPLQRKQQSGAAYLQKLRSLVRLMSERLQPLPVRMLRS